MYVPPPTPLVHRETRAPTVRETVSSSDHSLPTVLCACAILLSGKNSARVLPVMLEAWLIQRKEGRVAGALHGRDAKTGATNQPHAARRCAVRRQVVFV